MRMVKVVDAKNLRFLLQGRPDSDSFPEAFLRIAFADVVVLNKVDLLSNENGHDCVKKLEKEIKSTNSIASIVHAMRCQVDVSDILHLNYDGTHLAHLEGLMRESRSLSPGELHDRNVRIICVQEELHVDLYKVIDKGKKFMIGLRISFGRKNIAWIFSVRNSEMLHTLQVIILTKVFSSILSEVVK